MKNENFQIKELEVNEQHSERYLNTPKIGLIDNNLPEILFITSYPPRECGIATYSQDLIKALNNKFGHSFLISVCPLESDNEKHFYTDEIKYTLNTDLPDAFAILAKGINENKAIQIVMIQHEFGFFAKKESHFNEFLSAITKPIVVVFHTVLPNPTQILKAQVSQIASVAESIIVMTNSSANLLVNDYSIDKKKITVIPHGTHLVQQSDIDLLKNKYHLSGKKILSTFGLLSSGKSIETTLDALPTIVAKYPNVLFLIIGKTHPSVFKIEGEKYRTMLEDKVEQYHLGNYVKFINQFVPLHDLLEYLQLTDIYLFTSKDRNQAVSGTFSYAISCGCPVISTPIPHSREVLGTDAGIIIDFENSEQLSNAVIRLLKDDKLRKSISSNGLHRMASTAWENTAISHGMLFEKIDSGQVCLYYNSPKLNLNHIKKMTTKFGMIQFATISQPDINSGYTLDDNARAMVAMCQHFELTSDNKDLLYIDKYLKFIKYCLRDEGYFLNYVNEQQQFTEQNYSTNLADSNGRAIWALGYLVSISNLLPKAWQSIAIEASLIMKKALLNINKIHSTRAMAFVIKGLYYCNTFKKSENHSEIIKHLSNRMVQMYRHESDKEWLWFESYLTYANSILPEAMLCAWLDSGDIIYKDIAKSSFDFLLSKIFKDGVIKVISNKGWLHKSKDDNFMKRETVGGEQPIDVAYTILALSKFYDEFKDNSYKKKMDVAFTWFLGANHLHQIIYNPCTGGCYDGLEENYVNLNQGAESTVSYLMARLTIEKYLREYQPKTEEVMRELVLE